MTRPNSSSALPMREALRTVGVIDVGSAFVNVYRTDELSADLDALIAIATEPLEDDRFVQVARLAREHFGAIVRVRFFGDTSAEIIAPLYEGDWRRDAMQVARDLAMGNALDALSALAAIVMERGDLTEGQLVAITGLPRLTVRKLQDRGGDILDKRGVRAEWRRPPSTPDSEAGR